MKAAFQKDEALLASIASASTEPNSFTIWWLGQSGFLLQCDRRRLLFDPYLSDSLTVKYANTDRPHARLTERVIDPARLTGIDVVTSTHNHTDHLDAETLIALRKTNPGFRLVHPSANTEFIRQRLGDAMTPALGLNDGESAEVSGFTIHAVPAAHNEIERDAEGRCRCLGYLVKCGPWTIYHSGDTLLYPELPELLRALGPIDLALLPINGNRPERCVAGNLDGREAARLACEIGARCVIPCHYDMFAFNTADPGELFVPECERRGQPYRILGQGEGWQAGTHSSESSKIS